MKGIGNKVATWIGYAFFRWRRYYIVGKITEASFHNDNGLNPLKAKRGEAIFDIIYFSTKPPVGVAKESFAEDDKLLISNNFIKKLAKKAIELSTIDITKGD